MSRGIAVLILTVVALICTSAIILAVRPELILVIGLILSGSAA